MIFKNHSELLGLHAFLSASKYHWINYDYDKLEETFFKSQAAQRGTELHDLANRLIKMGIKLPKTKQTLNMYVNDAIGFKMQTEQVLFYSVNCFGTADAVSFKKNQLRIHDYKSGVTPASMTQLEVYAALFCLEYKYNPNDIDIELRMYQNDEVEIVYPLKENILYIMNKIVDFDNYIEKLKLEV